MAPFRRRLRTRLSGMLGVALALSLMLPFAPAQTQDPGSGSQSWTSTGSGSSATGNANPTRSRVSHTESGGRTVDSTSTERMGSDGRFEPYLETVRESVRGSAGSVRTVTRTYGRDLNGNRSLVQVVEEEQAPGGSGSQKTTRTVSNPDANGRLRVVQREEEVARSAGGVEDITRTVLSPDLNGTFTAVQRTQEQRTKTGEHDVQYKKTTLLPDPSGRWMVSEVREGTVRGEEGKGQAKDEKTLRPDAEGKLAVSERVVSRESAQGAGDSELTEETYSNYVPGSAGNNGLSLNRRVTTRRRSQAGGATSTEQKVEERGASAPADGLRPTQQTTEVSRPGLAGTTDTRRTVVSFQSNGSAQAVWVDTSQRQPSGTGVTVSIEKPKQ